jgi:hypothetical protein
MLSGRCGCNHVVVDLTVQQAVRDFKLSSPTVQVGLFVEVRMDVIPLFVEVEAGVLGPFLSRRGFASPSSIFHGLADVTLLPCWCVL